jgi:molybdopterin biosynthesis enzyme
MAGEPENQRIARLTPLTDVVARVNALVASVAPRSIELAGALSRALAEDVAAAVGQPAQPRALIDGYAVRAEDIGDAGSYAPTPLTKTPVRVDVGDALPPDADAVAPLDAIIDRGKHFEAVAPLACGDGVLPVGADLQSGDFVARKGWRLNDFNLAMLAAAGRDRVLVCEPHVRLVKARAGADTMIDAIADLLGRALHARGCAVTRDAEDLAAALTAPAVDAVICIGGTGNGRNDTSVLTLARHGRVEVHGIAIALGETAAFGMAANRPVLLLPGRMDAAIAGWLTMGLPLIDRLSGSSDAADLVVMAPLSRKVTSPLGLVEVVPVRLAADRAEPIASGYWPLGALAGTDGWVLVPAESEGFPVGAKVMVRPWP